MRHPLKYIRTATGRQRESALIANLTKAVVHGNAEAIRAARDRCDAHDTIRAYERGALVTRREVENAQTTLGLHRHFIARSRPTALQEALGQRIAEAA